MKRLKRKRRFIIAISNECKQLSIDIEQTEGGIRNIM